jgi:sec-independent protein translocase protein TatC
VKGIPKFLRRRRENPEARMSVLDHLRELRRRLIIIVVVVSAGAVLGWLVYPHVLTILEKPYCAVPPQYRAGGSNGCALIYTGVLDGFTTRLKISFIVGAIITAPFWLYQIWAFVTPGLRRNERKYTIIFLLSSTMLFALGVVLAYLVLYKGISILLRVSGTGTQALLTINAYLSFVVLMLVVFGAAFELPLLIVMANFAGVLPAKLLRKSQRLGIFLIFLFAAVATPSTDPYTMCAMAVPMVLLFEVAVGIAILHDRRKARREAAAAAATHLDDDVASAIDPIPQPLEDPGDSWLDTT